MNSVSELADPNTDAGAAEVAGGRTLKVNGFEGAEGAAPNPTNPPNFGAGVSWTGAAVN